MAADHSGMSLVEVLVAMVVLLIVALAMMQTALVSIDSNMRNVIRDEGTDLATKALVDLRNIDGETLDNKHMGKITYPVKNKTVRSATVPFTITNNVSSAGAENRNLEVTVSWTWKGEIYNTTLKTIRRKGE